MIKIYKIISGLLAKRLIRWGLIPLALCVFWIMASVFLNPNARFSFLSYSDSNLARVLKKDLLLKSTKLSGEFKANENHLGIVWLSFTKPKGVLFENEDTLVFRIKEKGSKNWYQANTYKSGLFYGYTLFPFGFSMIDNSKNKTYVFELESLSGNKNNAISIDKDNPVFISSYKIPPKEIFSNVNVLINFIFKKVITSFSTIQFFLYSTLYLIPLLYYLLLQISVKKIRFNGSFLMLIAVTIIFVDAFLIRDSYSGIILGTIGSWMVFLILSRFKTNASFILSFLCILLAVILISINLGSIVNKLANWGYYMLVIGILQELWILRPIYIKNSINKITKAMH